MKEYEIGIYTKVNSRYIPNRFIDGYIISADNKKQAGELAYEIYRNSTTAPVITRVFKVRN